MANEVTITISLDSQAGERALVSRGAEAPPEPMALDALGAPGGTSRLGGAQSVGEAPTPLPLDQLAAGASSQDGAGQPPSPLDSLPPADGATAPEPLSPEELPEKPSKK